MEGNTDLSAKGTQILVPYRELYQEGYVNGVHLSSYD